MKFQSWIPIGFACLSLGAPALSAADLAACGKLASMKLSVGSITAATPVDAGKFLPPGAPPNAANAALFKSLPAFCRVTAKLTPSSDSDIKMEVWLPVNWNEKFQAVGNGGWTGSIAYPALARALARGYAAASTDTGHEGERASFAIGHPEKLVDFAWRAVHETVVQSKGIIQTNYGIGPRYSYWNGCSSGGKQGLKEAQQFPDDFDGLITGAPANNWIHQKAAVVAVAQAVHKTPESYIPAEKYPAIHNAVLAACDRLDGVKDGILEDPRRCKFNPKALLCKAGESNSCLTAAQVESARKILAPARNPRTGAIVFPGIALGTELAWAVQAGKGARTVAEDLFSFVVFENPNWDFRTLDLDKDVALADKVDEKFRMAAVDPNLKPLFSHKGKLLMYHGWSDPNIVPENSINYYKSVVDTVGENLAKDSIRLFMVPGMGHCGGGEGPNQFDMVDALERWVEQGRAPERIIASRERDGAVERTRPLCAFPKVARYKGSGSTDSEANFACAEPAK